MELNDEKVQKITDLLKKIINIHDQNGGYGNFLPVCQITQLKFVIY